MTPCPSLAEASKLVMSYVAAVSSKGEEVNKVKEQLLQSNPVLEGECPHPEPHLPHPRPARVQHCPPGLHHNPHPLLQPLETPRLSVMTTPPDS